MMRRFVPARVDIFRGYARCLGRDFTTVSNALKMLMVHASGDRSALAGHADEAADVCSAVA